MHIRRLFSATIVAIAMVAAAAPSASHASIVIGTTRVVYDAASGEKTVRLTNKGESPLLMQAWLDTGSPQDNRATLDVPFIVSPTMARIDPEKSQTLRIIHTGEPLAQDRESLFWLNVLGIPARPDAADNSFLQLSIRSRIKFFFRPAGLAGTAIEAPAKLTWRLIQSKGQPALEAANPTPFHVSFASIEVASGSQAIPVEEPGMLAPFETRAFPLPRAAAATVDTRVRYQFINDYGGATAGEAVLQQAGR